ncbi:cytochrome c3 family protein [Fundidesulfovibrio butyratiphilus]
MVSKSPTGFRAAFVLAVLVGLALGWFVWPRLEVVRITQPLRFSHKVHSRQGVVCATCHFAPDGTFRGLPDLARCGACHRAASGGTSANDKEIDKFVWDYLSTRKPVPWLVSLALPDHVRFPHRPHLGARPESDCAACHADMAGRDSLDVLVNRITGQPLTAFSMQRCRDCHRKTKAPDSCEACHR